MVVEEDYGSSLNLLVYDIPSSKTGLLTRETRIEKNNRLDKKIQRLPLTWSGGVFLKSTGTRRSY